MKIFAALPAVLICLVLPCAAPAEDRMISGEFPYEYVEKETTPTSKAVPDASTDKQPADKDWIISDESPSGYIEREPTISNSATVEDVLTERFSEHQPIQYRDPSVVFQMLLSFPISTSVSASVSTTSTFGPDFSASGDLEPKAQPAFEFRKIIWNDAPDKISWSYGLSIISIKGEDAAGARASATLMALPLHFTFRGFIGESEERPEGVLVPYGAIGAFYYLGSFSVDMGASSGGTTSGLGVPDVRGGLQWNINKETALILELRYFSVKLDYSGGEYDIFNSDSATMNISQSLMSIGFKSGF